VDGQRQGSGRLVVESSVLCNVSAVRKIKHEKSQAPYWRKWLRSAYCEAEISEWKGQRDFFQKFSRVIQVASMRFSSWLEGISVQRRCPMLPQQQQPKNKCDA
jgi:hypothetical protein